MSELRANEWRETCLRALCEREPDRRMAALERLRRILRKEIHKFGPLWVDFGTRRGETKR